MVNFWRRNCLYFLNPPVMCVKSRVFFLLVSSFFLVWSMFSVVAILHRSFLDHRYFSWFSFNLLFGPLKKSFCFWEEKFKNIILLFVLVLKKKKILVILFWWNQFLLYICFFMPDLENMLPFSVFLILFLENFVVSLCFCPPKKPLKNDWFSLLFLLTSSRFVLSLCVLSLCLPSLLLLFLLTKKCGKKKYNVFYYYHSIFLKKSWQKHSFHFGNIILFFLFLFPSKQERHFCEQIPFILELSLFYLS